MRVCVAKQSRAHYFLVVMNNIILLNASPTLHTTSNSMASLAEILDNSSRGLREREVWCILHSALKYFSSFAKDAVATLIVSPECLLIQKGQVRFVSGDQKTTSQEYMAPEELHGNDLSSEGQDIEKLKLYSLGKVLGNAMDSDNISEQLQATVNRMIEQDPRERQGMAELLKVTCTWLDALSSTEPSVQAELERLTSHVFGDVQSIDSELVGDNNLADEIEASEARINRFSVAESGGSSLSLNSSRGSFYEDGLSRSDSQYSNISDMLLRKKPLVNRSFNTHSKREGDAAAKKSQFYTPVRSRKTSDKASLPPLPRPPSDYRNQIEKRPPSDSDMLPTSPLLVTEMVVDDCPPLPPVPQANKTQLANDELPSGQDTPPKSLKQIQDILESSSAPDLLEIKPSKDRPLFSERIPDKLAIFSAPEADNETNKGSVPPTPPPPSTLPPSLSPPSLNVTNHETIHQDAHREDNSAIMAETTFDYTDMSPIRPNLNVTASEDDFQLTPPPIPVRSPSKSNMEVTPPPLPIGSPPKSDVELTPPSSPPPKNDDGLEVSSIGSYNEQSVEKESNQQEDPVYSDPTERNVIEHDEFGYSIPYKKTKQQPASRQDSFEQTQTLDRTKNILMKEEMTKAPSEGVVIPAIPPSLNLPERASMPVEPMDSNGYELIDISFPPAKKETNRNPPVQTTSFIEVEQQDDKKSEVASIKNKVVDFKVETEINDTALLQFTEVSDKSYSHGVIVHCPAVLVPHPQNMGVRPHSTCGELFKRIVKALKVDEDRTFGLSVIQDKEVIFMEDTKEIHKYAPDKKWKKQKKPPPFRVYFRVMYFLKNPSSMRESQTRMIHYHEVKSLIIKGSVSIPEEKQLILAALALQADSKERHLTDNEQYFNPNKYMSVQAIDNTGGTERTYELVSQMHSRCPKMTPERAMFCYLEEALKIDDLSIIFYGAEMALRNKEQLEHVFLGFSPNGIKVCRQVQFNKETIQHCMWKGTSKIASSNDKLLIKCDGFEQLTLYTNHYRRARYFVSMARFYHQFSREMRDRYPVSLMKGLDDAERKIIVEGQMTHVDEYDGETIMQKILKDETNSLGFTIKNHTSPIKLKYVEVDSITKGGPAYQAKCPKPGDLILAVNDINMVGKKHSDVGTFLKNSPPLVELILFRRLDKQDTMYNFNGEVIEVTLERDQKVGLGLSLKNYISPQKVNYVQTIRIKEGGPAYTKGCPQEGDFIVWLNGEDVVGLNHKEMGQRLKANKVSQIKVLRVPEKERPVPAQKSEETDSSFKTIEVQYTGDEELSSAVEISPNKETVAMNISKNPQGKTEVTDEGQISKKVSTTTLDRDSSLSSDNGPALPMSPTDVRVVKLRKQNSSFGFAISGRSNNPYRSIYISRITEGGPADDCGLLNIGDHILSVNGDSVEGQSYNEVFKILRSQENEVTLEVCPPDDSSGRISVELDRSKGQLGIRIRLDQGRIVVADLTKGSQAFGSGIIHKGDEILQVNGTSFYGLSAREATDVLMNCKSPVYILLKSSVHTRREKFNFVQSEDLIPEADETGEFSSLNRQNLSEAASESPKPSPQQGRSPSSRSSPPQGKKLSPKLSPPQSKSPSPKTSPPQYKSPSPKPSPPQQYKSPSPKPSPPQGKRHSPKPSPLQQYKSPSPKPSPPQGKRLSPKPATSSTNSSFEEYAYEQIKVTLRRGQKGFGFKIRKDVPAERKGKGLFIASIDLDPALSDGRLKVGDEILKINGVNLVGVAHQTGVQTMRGVQDEGVITIQRRVYQLEKREIANGDEEIPDELKNPVDEYSSLKQLMATKVETIKDTSIPQAWETIEAGLTREPPTSTFPPVPETTPPTLDTIEEVDSDWDVSKIIDEEPHPPPPLPSTAPPIISRPSSMIINEEMTKVKDDNVKDNTAENEKLMHKINT